MGYTLTHEHFQLDFHHFYCSPPNHLSSFFVDPKIQIDSLGLLRQYPYSSQYNLQFNDLDTKAAIKEDLSYYKRFGGVSIAENTSHGLKRDLQFMKEVSDHCDVQVIAGTGHYLAMVQDPSTLALSTEALVEMYTRDMMEGENGIKCGFVGEVGSGYPIAEFELRSLRATAAVSESLKCGVSFHPGRDHRAPFELVRLFLEAGGRKDKCVMSHVDRTIMDVEQVRRTVFSILLSVILEVRFAYLTIRLDNGLH